MKSACFLLTVGFGILLTSPLLAATEQPTIPSRWTAPAAAAYALQHNPDVRTAQERIKAAEADIAMARAAFYPQLGVSAEYSRTNNPMYSFGNILNQGMFSNAIDFNDPGETDNLQTKATVLYRLYNGGQDQATLDTADERSRAISFEQAAVRIRLEFEAVRAFCSIVQAEETIKARQMGVEAINSSLAAAQARFAAGDLLKDDLLALEVQRSQAQERLIQAQQGLLLVQRGFLHLLGLEGGRVTVDAAAPWNQVIPAERDIKNRPELAGMTAMVKAQEAQVRQARAGRMPTADAFGSYQTDKGTTMEEGSGSSWATGIRLNYTLFDGQRTGATIERAEALLRVAREQQRKMELACSLERDQASIALRQEEERLKVTGAMVASAMESTRLARQRFKEGLLLATELLASENRLTDARLSLSMATASRRIALADLRRAIGLRQFTQGD